jgi:hypothetical protein
MNARPRRSPIHGNVQMDLIAAIAVLTIAILPLGFGILHHRTLVRDATTRAVALELLDSEMEVLAAGEHRSFQEGTHPYPLTGAAALNLPPGSCLLTRVVKPQGGIELHLEWKPTVARAMQPVRRSVQLASTPNTR